MPWFLSRWFIGAVGALLLCNGLYWWGHASGRAAVQAKWNAEKLKTEREVQAAAAKVRQAERDMQAEADKHQKEKRDEIDRLVREHRAVVDSLRKRPQRPEPSAVPSSAGLAQGQSGCTGAELHREDAEFLAGEAARADTIRAELEACYAQYDALRAPR